ncbi:hypothetical protein HGRIS_004392 [Hohenbuehelia grisea]|uniref:Uncharacterized protein n=1 Tax=Hohenbuehelia grisea TaxID=104357 RepID=A0ABR3JCI2_9AGAR
MLNSIRLCSLLLFTFLAIRGSLAAPLDKRLVPPIIILTNANGLPGPGAQYACSNDQTTDIANAIDQVKAMAQTAADTLRTPGVSFSSGFFAFFGTGNPEWIAQTFFDPLTSLGEPMTAEHPKFRYPSRAITITCPDNDNGVSASAETTTTIPSVIRLWPRSFISQATIQSDAQAWNLHLRFTNGYRGALAHTLFHELLHAAVLIPEPHRCIDVIYTTYNTEGQPTGTGKAYAIDACQRLGSADKLRNVQNFEWFAFLAVATPQIYQDNCYYYYSQYPYPVAHPGPIPSHQPVQLPIAPQPIAPQPIIPQRRAVGSTSSVPSDVGGAGASSTGGPTRTLSTPSTPEGACTATEFSQIQSALPEVKLLAGLAAERLRAPGVAVSTGFVALFGNNDPEKIARSFFDPIADLEIPQEADSADIDTRLDAVVIQCYPEDNLEIADMTTGIPSKMRLFPKAFKGAEKLQADVDEWRRRKTYANGNYPALAQVLLHEILHSALVVLEPCIDVSLTVRNQKMEEVTVAAYPLFWCRYLRNEDKIRNSQTFVWFAFLVCLCLLGPLIGMP